MDTQLYLQPLEQPGREAEKAGETILLTRAFGSGTVLRHRADGSPYVDIEGVYISISHCRSCVALAVSDRPVGVDVETCRDQLGRVAHRVMSSEEVAYYRNNLVEAWTLKEALYKAALTPGLDFRNQIQLPLDKSSTATVLTPGPQTFTVLRSQWLEQYRAWLSLVVSGRY